MQAGDHTSYFSQIKTTLTVQNHHSCRLQRFCREQPAADSIKEPTLINSNRADLLLLSDTPRLLSPGVPKLRLIRAEAPLKEQNLCKNPREPFLMWSAGNQSSPPPLLSPQPNVIPLRGEERSSQRPGKTWRVLERGGAGVSGLVVPISTGHLTGWRHANARWAS